MLFVLCQDCDRILSVFAWVDKKMVANRKTFYTQDKENIFLDKANNCLNSKIHKSFLP